jgi:CDP-glycerol glycerophosphotransferase (TagB/SpsB family)
LSSDRLAELAAHAGLRVSFLPHPNMSALCSEWSFPASVDVHRYEDVDLQEIFARSAMMITDYSSNVVEAAYLQRPVIYFQFDRAEFFSGLHGRRRGQWSDDHDGFGPVVERASDVLDELEHLVNVGVTPQEPYATRMAEAFAFRDGKSCERVFDSIVAARRPPALSRRTPRR